MHRSVVLAKEKTVFVIMRGTRKGTENIPVLWLQH